MFKINYIFYVVKMLFYTTYLASGQLLQLETGVYLLTYLN